MSELYLFRHEFGMDFDELKDFSNMMEELLESKLKKFNKMVERKSRKVPIDELEDFYSYLYHDAPGGIGGYQLQDRFPELLRKSVFTSCYASFEVELLNYCKYLKKTKNISLSLSDLKHEGITKAQVYIKKVVGSPFPDGNSPEWGKITCFNLIRNKIVHNNSIIDDDTSDRNSAKLQKFISENPYVIVNDQSTIQLDREFSNDFLQTAESFFRQLYGASAFEPFVVVEEDPFKSE